ncbi:MAG: hypothetical protein CM1200mP9_00520 [Gammaproteobacteria bacterium]|nr:MAG: hypothetical protein CM1200mP9_00520 [Gammaproteobacteria bacterium]
MMEIGEVRKIVEAALLVAGEALSVEQLERLFVEGDLDRKNREPFERSAWGNRNGLYGQGLRAREGCLRIQVSSASGFVRMD